MIGEALEKIPACAIKQTLLAIDDAHGRGSLLFPRAGIGVICVDVCAGTEREVRHELAKLG